MEQKLPISSVLRGFRPLKLVQALPLHCLTGEFMKKSLSISVAVFLTMALVACGSKKDESVQPGAGATGNVSGLNFPRNAAVEPTETVVKNSDQTRFQIMIDAFLSPVLQPGVDYGKVSSQNGFYITGFIELDGANNVVVSNSGIMFRVFDTFTQSNNVQPLTMGIPLKVAKVSGNPVQLIFEDQYSRLVIDATVNVAKMSGRVSFQSLLSPLPSWTPTENNQQIKQGVIGDFEVETCKFFKCLP
jgi:hypothetical protein